MTTIDKEIGELVHRLGVVLSPHQILEIKKTCLDYALCSMMDSGIREEVLEESGKIYPE